MTQTNAARGHHNTHATGREKLKAHLAVLLFSLLVSGSFSFGGIATQLIDPFALQALRYALTGVGAWNEAGIDKMQAFLARWRGSRFTTLNAGGNVLVKLTSSSFYLLPESWPSTGYPGPLEYVFKAVNS